MRHLQQIELRRHLEQRALELRLAMHRADVADRARGGGTPAVQNGDRRSQLRQGRSPQRPDAVPRAVHRGDELVAVDTQTRASAFVVSLSEAG